MEKVKEDVRKGVETWGWLIFLGVIILGYCLVNLDYNKVFPPFPPLYYLFMVMISGAILVSYIQKNKIFHPGDEWFNPAVLGVCSTGILAINLILGLFSWIIYWGWMFLKKF